MQTKNPLTGLIGTWKGNKGIDLAPKPDEDENNPYYETLIIEPVDTDIENAEEQELTTVRYHQEVREIANDKISHSESGYWIWDINEQSIMCAFSIPRGVSMVCGGTYKAGENDGLTFEVHAGGDYEDWQIAQSPFMKQKATTLAFTRTFKLQGNTLSYAQETTVEIYNKTFAHHDSNTLTKVI